MSRRAKDWSGITTKQCARCGETKPLDAFFRNPTGGAGRTSICKPCTTIRKREYARSPKGHVVVRSRRLKYTYGITLAKYEQILTAQNGACGICGRITSKALHVDHDHETGKIRGLLCNRCNLGLGLFDDSALVLLRASRYMSQYD